MFRFQPPRFIFICAILFHSYAHINFKVQSFNVQLSFRTYVEGKFEPPYTYTYNFLEFVTYVLYVWCAHIFHIVCIWMCVCDFVWRCFIVETGELASTATANALTGFCALRRLQLEERGFEPWTFDVSTRRLYQLS